MPNTPDELRALLRGLTAGERHAECCICFDDLCDSTQTLACFTCNGARTCPHFFHQGCAQDVLREDAPHCPLCRHEVDDYVAVPSAADDADAWFGVVDVENNGQLSRAQVLSVLVSQFPVDAEKLEEALPMLWQRWDMSSSGFVSRQEFVDPQRGLLAFVRKELLHEPSTPAATEPSVTPQATTETPPMAGRSSSSDRHWADDPRVWFDIYDENRSGMLSHDTLLRALVRSNRRLSLAGARETIATLGLATEAEAAGGGDAITFERFLEIHNTLLATNIEQQEDNALETVMAMLEALCGAEHGIDRDMANQYLWEENGIISRAVNRLEAAVGGVI